MTLPVVPGPFDFIGQLGEAAGGIIDARNAANEKAQQDKMIRDRDYLERISVLADLFGHKALELPEVQRGVERIFNFDLADTLSASPTRQSRASVAELEIIKAENQAAVIAGGEDAGPQTAAGRAAAGTPSEDVAKAAERTVVAGADTAEAQANLTNEQAIAQVMDNDEQRRTMDPRVIAQIAGSSRDAATATAQTTLYLQLDSTLKSDPEFANLAVRFASGVYQYDLQQMRASMSIMQGQGQMDAKFLDAILSGLESGRDFNEELDQAWQTCMSNERRQEKEEEDAMGVCGLPRTSADKTATLMATLAETGAAVGITGGQISRLIRQANNLSADLPGTTTMKLLQEFASNLRKMLDQGAITPERAIEAAQDADLDIQQATQNIVNMYVTDRDDADPNSPASRARKAAERTEQQEAIQGAQNTLALQTFKEAFKKEEQEEEGADSELTTQDLIDGIEQQIEEIGPLSPSAMQEGSLERGVRPVGASGTPEQREAARGNRIRLKSLKAQLRALQRIRAREIADADAGRSE